MNYPYQQQKQTRQCTWSVNIHPHFELCCVIWGNCTHNLEEKLVKLQESAARVILECDFYTPSCVMFAELK